MFVCLFVFLLPNCDNPPQHRIIEEPRAAGSPGPVPYVPQEPVYSNYTRPNGMKWIEPAARTQLFITRTVARLRGPQLQSDRDPEKKLNPKPRWQTASRRSRPLMVASTVRTRPKRREPTGASGAYVYPFFRVSVRVDIFLAATLANRSVRGTVRCGPKRDGYAPGEMCWTLNGFLKNRSQERGGKLWSTGRFCRIFALFV